MAAISKTKRTLIFAKFNGRCAYCGDPLSNTYQVDHVIPKKNFVKHILEKVKVPYFLKHLTVNDVNNIDNLFPSCYSCNSYKDSMDIETFRSELNQFLRRLNQYSTLYKISKRYGLVTETNTDIVFYFENQKKMTCDLKRHYFDCDAWHKSSTGCMNCIHFIDIRPKQESDGHTF